MSTEQAIQAQAMFEPALLSKSNVVGVAVGYKDKNGETGDELAVVVLVEQKKPLAALAAEDVVPKELDGMRTDVVEVGYLRAYQTPKDRFRPIIPNGVSIGHYKITAGTLGTVVKDRTTGEKLLLSNNHVLANCNEALVGDAVLQPAAMDGGKEVDDLVARLERFIPLRFIDDPVTEPPKPTPTPPTKPGNGNETPPVTNPTPPGGCDVVSAVAGLANVLARVLGSDKRVQVASRASAAAMASAPAVAPTAFPVTTAVQLATVPENRVDCALAKPLDPDMFSDDILEIGVVDEMTEPELGMRVRKHGRTTGYTEGLIKLLNATVNVGYVTSRGPRTARLIGQVITENISRGGDSGSLIVSAEENAAVGLLFAGSELATIFTPIDMVLNALNVTL